MSVETWTLGECIFYGLIVLAIAVANISIVNK